MRLAKGQRAAQPSKERAFSFAKLALLSSKSASKGIDRDGDGDGEREAIAMNSNCGELFGSLCHWNTTEREREIKYLFALIRQI